MSMTRAGLSVAVALTAFFAPAIFTPAQFVYRDTGILHTPMKRWIAGELTAGRFPQWNPWSGLGTPVVSNAIDALQHPFNLLLLTLPPSWALKSWILLSFALAAAGAFAWARTLGRSAAACAVAAIAFALSGPLVSASDNVTFLSTYAALPWLFAAVTHLRSRGVAPLPIMAVGASSALCAAGGDPQAWGLAVLALPAYVMALAPAGERRAAVAAAVAATAAAILFAAPFILPAVLWYPHTSRVGGALAAGFLARAGVRQRQLEQRVSGCEMLVGGRRREIADAPDEQSVARGLADVTHDLTH